jgi:hypothetical protein
MADDLAASVAALAASAVARVIISTERWAAACRASTSSFAAAAAATRFSSTSASRWHESKRTMPTMSISRMPTKPVPASQRLSGRMETPAVSGPSGSLGLISVPID